MEIEGYCIRTTEEDEGAVDEPLIIKKDDKKKGKKGKWNKKIFWFYFDFSIKSILFFICIS